MNTPTLYDIFIKNPNICTDSRKAEPNSIFFALRGKNFDGNKFAARALDKCAYAVVDDKDIAVGSNYIVVDNVLVKLQQLARYHRKRLGLPIIAITGTNGKTTTKELVSRVLKKKYMVGYTRGNLNNHIGVPLTLLSFNSQHQIGVVEMGANHIGEINELCKIAAPDFGIVTNVGKAHLEGFGSFDGVKKAKAELYRYLYENDGVAFVNYDNEHLEDMNPPHSVIYYGTKGFTHCQGKIEDNGIFLTLRWMAGDDELKGDKPVDWWQTGKLIETRLYGSYNFENVMAAICVGKNFHVPDGDIKNAIESYMPDNIRSQIVKTESNTLFVDSYNANPTSMRAALENFDILNVKNKIVVLGDMFELGVASTREHGALLGLLGEIELDKVMLVGENFFQYNGLENIEFFESTDKLLAYLSEKPLCEKHILIKGSRAMGLEKLIDVL